MSALMYGYAIGLGVSVVLYIIVQVLLSLRESSRDL